MFDKYENLSYEIEEEEFDEGYEGRLAQIESNLEKLTETQNENYEDKYLSADDIEKMVINLDEKQDDELKKVNERLVDDIIDAEIESNKLGENRGINESETLESYYQPELVKQWEDVYHSENQAKEQEEILSQEVLNDMQKSMDDMQNQNENSNMENNPEDTTENITEDPSKISFHDQLANAMDEFMSVDNNDLVGNEQEGENLDIGLDLEMGNAIQDGMSSEFDTEIGEDLESEEDADMNTAFDMDNSS